MSKKIFLAAFVFIATAINAQEKNELAKPQIVEASCGQCQFGMTEKRGCDLAVRIDGKAYFVDGTSIDKHGDAHADDGFCVTIKKAEVVGEVIDNRFKSTSFKLISETAEVKK